MRKRMFQMVTVCVIAVLGLVSCQTTGQSAALGAIIGGAGGAILGNQNRHGGHGHAGQGALIGAALGGLTGFLVGKTVEKQVATRAEVEKEYQAKGKTVTTEPTIQVEDLKATPASVKHGDKMQVSGTYAAVGADTPKPVGQLRVLKEGEQVAQTNLDLKNTGRSEFSREISVPQDLAPGTYVLEVKMSRGASQDVKSTGFVVASN